MKAGTLEIELISNVLKLQSEMEQIKRSVGTMQGAVAGSAKAANDNFRSIAASASDTAKRINAATGVMGEGFRRSEADIAAYGAEMDRLRAKYNPLFAVGQQYKTQLGEIRQAHAVGAISAQEMQAAITRLQAQTAASANAIRGNTKALEDSANTSGSARAGMQQLSYQLGDAATMFSMGANASQIFASQLGQTVQAVQLMSGGTSRLAAFLGGPWGIALSVGVIAMAPFIGKLWDVVTGANAATGALESMIQKYRQGLAEKLKFQNADKDLNGLLQKRAELEADLAKGNRTGFMLEGAWLEMKRKQLKDINKEIADSRSAIDAERNATYSLAQVMDFGTAATEKSTAATGRKTGAVRGTTKAVKEATEAAETYNDMVYRMFSGNTAALPDVGMESIVADLSKARDGARELQGALQIVADMEFKALQDTFKDLDFSAFGNAGSALEGMVESMTRMSEATYEYNKAIKAAGGDSIKQARAEAKYDKDKLYNTAAMLGSAKKLFKEQSAGYKMVEAAEKAAAALAVVNTAKNVAAGASKIFSQLGWWAFPVVGAMVATMASLGFRGGGSVAAPMSAEDTQAAIGTGTVLGDSSAQSESLTRSLEVMAENSNSDLEYSNEMVRHLRAISNGIGALTGRLARQFNLGAGGMFSTSSLGLGQSGSGGFLGMFGSSTSRSLYDQGLKITGQEVQSALVNGLNAQVYSVIQTIKTSSGFFGIGGGTSTTYRTTLGPVANGIDREFGAIIGDLADSVVSFVTQMGQTTNKAVNDNLRELLGTMQLPTLNLSLKDMTGDEIEKALNAYFSQVGDLLANVASQDGGFNLSQFQKVGEGLYETLARVTRTLMTVDSTLRAAGLQDMVKASGSLAGAIASTDALVNRFGGADAFSEAVGFYTDKFLTEAERMAPVITSVRAEMDRLGLSAVTSNDAFKQVVQGLDLTTASGQEMFASLMAVAPAFAKTTEYLDKLNGVVQETGQTAAQALAAATSAVDSAKSALQQAVSAERSAIEGRLNPLRSELDRLMGALQPEKVDLIAAMQVRDVMSEGLAVAEKLAGASRNVLRQNEKIVEIQRQAAMRELYRMAETRRIDADRIDTLIESATAFGGDYATEFDMYREQVRTASLLQELSEIQEENARAAQVKEDRRAEEARLLVFEQIAKLQEQIAIEELALTNLDETLLKFDLVNESVLSVRDAVLALQGALKAQAAAGASSAVGGGATAPSPQPYTPAPVTPTPTLNPSDSIGLVLPMTPEYIAANNAKDIAWYAQMAPGAMNGAMMADGTYFDPSVQKYVEWEGSPKPLLTAYEQYNVELQKAAHLAALAGQTQFDAATSQALEDMRLVAESQSSSAQLVLNRSVPAYANGGFHVGGLAMVGEEGPELVNMGPSRVWTADETRSMLSGNGGDAELRAEMRETKEYIRELVRINIKQERRLREIEMQGETV